MVEQFTKLLAQYGIGSSIVGIVLSIIVVVIKSQPVTFLTSTRVERILYSKERQLSLKIVKFIFQVLITSLAFFWIMIASNDLQFKYYVVTTWLAVGYLVGSAIFYLYKVVKNKNSYNYFKSLSNKQRFILLIALLFFCAIFITLPAFFLGSSIDEKLLDPKAPDFWVSFIAFFCISIFISFFLTFSLKSITSELFSLGFNFSDIYLYIEDKDQQKWFLYHSTDKTHFLVGNKPNHEDSTTYELIEKSVLRQNKIYIYKKIKRNLR